MEAFVHQGYSKKKLKILNLYRKYLQVLILSDIMTGDGDCFTMSFKCEKDHQPHNTYKWPHQPEPSTSIMKKIWKRALRKTFGLRSRITSHKLGIWLHSNLSNWVWFFHPYSTSIYQHFGLVWRVWKRETNKVNLEYHPNSNPSLKVHDFHLPLVEQQYNTGLTIE